MNQGPVVGDEPCSTIFYVPLNVSSSKIDDVVVNAASLFFCAPLASLFFIVSFARIIHFF